MNFDSYDVVIVGGGAAGLSAALVLGRARRRVAVVDSGTPRNAPASHMHGFLSRDGLPPSELLRIGREELGEYGVDIVYAEVTGVTNRLEVTLGGGRVLSARRLLLASGAVDVLPEIAGARERWGSDFLHCPYCHGWEVRDRAIGVIGSVEHAHLLRQWSGDVVFFPHTTSVSSDDRQSLRARGVEVVDGAVVELVDGGVRLETGGVVPRDAVFIRPELRPRNEQLIGALGCEVDELGFVAVAAMGRTSVPGVWAAGNVANPRAQVITAAGEGSAAAIDINNDLVQEDSR